MKKNYSEAESFYGKLAEIWYKKLKDFINNAHNMEHPV